MGANPKMLIQPHAPGWRIALDAANAATRCGAKTRRGTPCLGPKVKGRPRCRMHGGAKGSGAPLGNKNRLMHGRFTAKAIAERRALRALQREIHDLLAQLPSQ
jgi:hypothetical protein